MSVGGYILVVCRGGNIIGKGEAMVIILEMHIKKTLVGSVKRDASLGHGHEGLGMI